MKALILAAGIGSRLAPITNSIPKCMVPINGKPIIKKQIDNLLSANIHDITIVTGYLSNTLTKFLYEQYPFVKIIESIDFLKTNNMYSAYLAKSNFYGHSFIMMNADVYFDDCIINDLTSSSFKNAIAVDISCYLEESMKIKVINNKVVAIAKNILLFHIVEKLFILIFYVFTTVNILSFYQFLNNKSFLQKMLVLG